MSNKTHKDVLIVSLSLSKVSVRSILALGWEG
jgi:hypothetical protein